MVFRGGVAVTDGISCNRVGSYCDMDNKKQGKKATAGLGESYITSLVIDRNVE